MDLIEIKDIDGELRIDSRDIAERLENDHKNVIEMIRKHDQRLQKYGRVTFKTIPLSTNGGYQKFTICFLNEKQATFLVTLSRNSDKAVELKQNLVDSYFHYKEKNQIQIPGTFAEALQLAADQAKQLEEAKPAIDFHKQVGDSKGLHNMAETAKLLNLGFGRNTLMKNLRETKVLMDNNAPYQMYVDLGYLELKENVVGGNDKFLKPQPFVTGKGLKWLQKRFK